MTLSQRDRLLLTFAELAGYGIAAHESLAAGPDEAHAALRAELTARHPDGLGSYVFWTARDDSRFDVDGQLTSPLAVHVSAEEVAVAALAAGRSYGLRMRPVEACGPVLLVQPLPGRTPAPAGAASGTPAG
jgi:hypothetical protein